MSVRDEWITELIDLCAINKKNAYFIGNIEKFYYLWRVQL